MQPRNIIYYGAADLQAQVLATYLAKLGYGFQPLESKQQLLTVARTAPESVIVVALPGPPPVLMRFARELVSDPSSAFPHIFILYEGEPFDTQLEAITLIAGPARLQRLVEHLVILNRHQFSRTGE